MMKWITDIFATNKRFHQGRKLQTSTQPRLEVLEGRVLLNGDLLIWNPTDGTNLASHAANWWDDTQQMQGVEAPGLGANGGEQVWLQFTKSNAPIIWDKSVTLSNFLLTGGGGARGSPGYSGEQTVNDGVTITTVGIGENGTSYLDMQLGGTGNNGATGLFIDGGNNALTEFTFTGTAGTPANNIVEVYGNAVVTMGWYSNYTEVVSGAELAVGGSQGILQIMPASNTESGCPLWLQNGAFVNIIQGGNLSLSDNGYTGGAAFIMGDGANGVGQNGEQVEVGYGGYVNVSCNGNNTLAVPVVNEGSFTLDGTNNGGQLNVLGARVLISSGYSLINITYDPATGDSLGEQESGMVFLQGGATLFCQQGYFQQGSKVITLDETISIPATLSTDASDCTLSVGDGAQIGIGLNSYVYINPIGPTYQTLTFIGTVSFSGIFRPKINGSGGGVGKEDVLTVNGTITFGVASVAPLIQGDTLVSAAGWLIVTDTLGPQNVINWGNVQASSPFTIDSRWPGYLFY